ncbi:MAG: DegT/DnrJ/EryC1/StrS family aminotransferase, partial [Candidatus Heimdallarchaeaceae archaeon]
SLQRVLPGNQHSDYIMAPIILSKEFSREKMIEHLKNNNIGSRSFYSLLSYQQPCYQDLSSWSFSKVIDYPDYSKVSCPNAEFVASKHFELPMVTSLTDENIEYIVTITRNFFEKS